MRVCYNQKGKEKAKKGNWLFKPVFASRTFYSRNYSSSFFPRYHRVSNYRECTANDASSIPARWRSVKNRSIYWAAVPFTMVNMCVLGQWRVDAFAAAWHLIYGCMQGEGWSRPPLSLNQIISAPGKNKWWLPASLNSLSHIFILFIYCRALLSLRHPQSFDLSSINAFFCSVIKSIFIYTLLLLINAIPS